MTETPSSVDPEQRLLILAPSAKDARLTCEILRRSAIACLSCADLRELCAHLCEGAAGALIAEEFFAREESKLLMRFLDEQPAWSDLPVILLMRQGRPSPFAHRIMETLANILLLERPTQSSMLVSAARAALRERGRQYTVRDQLQELERRRAALEENEEALTVARRQAEEASRAKSEFLANMSHEIRTPMTGFMAAIEYLLAIEKDPEHLRILDMADRAGKHLRSLIDDILDFSRIEARKVEISEEPFDLRAFIDDIAQIFTLSCREKDLRFAADIPPDLPPVIIGDPDKVGQVLINLIGNAVKFTQEGEIRLDVTPRAGLLEFAVTDTGIGIPEDKQQMLFESFSQVDGSFNRDYGGTGLGLAISKSLVELMGGEVSVRSREGEGSSFSFTIPLKTAGDQPSPGAPHPAEENEDTPTMPVLLAEDDPMIREMISAMLKQKGWTVETADNGREALERWQGGKFPVILMDLQMPEMDGIEVTQAIRKREASERGRCYIIGLTAHTSPEVRQECMAAGMNEVLTKPFQTDDLFSAISECR